MLEESCGDCCASTTIVVTNKATSVIDMRDAAINITGEKGNAKVIPV